MKSTFKFASAMLLMASSAAFAAPQTTAHPGAQPAAAAHATAPAPAPAKADMKAENTGSRPTRKPRWHRAKP